MIRKLLTLASAAAALATATMLPAQAARPDGGALFRQRCASCHSVSPGQRPVLAPNLSGVVGRKAGSTAFASYSPALKSSNLTWTRANLDRFLTAPSRLVPGTRMVVSIPDVQQRSAVLDYLAHPIP
jgi:cytochrome c